MAIRDGAGMGELGSELLGSEIELGSEAREYLVMAAMAGYVASGRKARALEVWGSQGERLAGKSGPALRLLRCHAEAAGACAEAF